MGRRIRRPIPLRRPLPRHHAGHRPADALRTRPGTRPRARRAGPQSTPTRRAPQHLPGMDRAHRNRRQRRPGVGGWPWRSPTRRNSSAPGSTRSTDAPRGRPELTRYGLRGCPKSKKSHRAVPVPPHTPAAMKQLMEGRWVWGRCTCPKVTPDGQKTPGSGPCPGLMFPAAKGGPLNDNNFRQRYGNPAVEAARLCGKLSPSVRASGAGCPRQDHGCLAAARRVFCRPAGGGGA